MNEITRKTELEPLDGTPEKRMFWSLISDYDLTTGITELADNAIDIWMTSDRSNALEIDVNLDSERQIIRLSDTAGGIPKENLRLLIAPGGSMNSPDGESIGIFGVGSKRSVVAIAENTTIKTHHRNDSSYQIDITREWLESADWQLPAYAIPEIKSGTTEIELTKLRKPVQVTDKNSLVDHFSETYEWFLRHHDVRLKVNGTKAIPKRFDNWAFPPGFEPRCASFEIYPDHQSKLNIEITAGLITDRDPSAENYGVYIYCNNRLIVKHLKNREVGYYIGSEAGVPHPDASLCRAVVNINGPAKLMPWNSSKNGVNFAHEAFVQLRPTLIQLVSHFSSLSRRLKDDWNKKVFDHSEGQITSIPSPELEHGRKLVLPPLPRVQRNQIDRLKAKNSVQIEEKPWTLGLIEAISAVDIVARQRLVTGNRIALILLDSNFEIALKEFIVHRGDLFNPVHYNDSKISEIFSSRHKVIQTVISAMPLEATLLERARHYYNVRNKLIHERATVGIATEDVNNYRRVIETILLHLFDLKF
jgi:hypothetical protein